MDEDPASGATFLSRYRAARSQSIDAEPTSPSSPTSPTAPAAPAAPPAEPAPEAKAPTSPRTVPRPAAKVWGSVFHPAGRSPTTGSRYDTPSTPGAGESASELHDAGRAGMTIHGRIQD